MKFVRFNFENFKGIRKLTFELNQSPSSNVYTLVGLNESGKTTILEAISNFDPNLERGPIEKPEKTIDNDPNAFLPLSERANFGKAITIGAELEFESEDIEELNKYLNINKKYSEIKDVTNTIYRRFYNFENSKFKDINRTWSPGFKVSERNDPKGTGVNLYEKDKKTWIELDKICNKRIPDIVYFPNFLFDFPSRIYLSIDILSTDEKEEFYKKLIQDILYSLDINVTIEEHLINRIKSDNENDKSNLRRIIQLMEDKVTNVIFESWYKMFKKEVKASRIKIESGEDSIKGAYLEFYIESSDGVYNVKDRSLGFRWFFTFLLFTQFRPYRPDSKKGLIFLFDEPASNLHSSAQNQLLKHFENFGNKVTIIYTTHSHYMINPNWLESTYVVKNGGFNVESSEDDVPNSTNVTVEHYRTFVSKNPKETSYFQPVLDILEYVPSELEKIPSCVFLEGKNDFYTLKYFNEVILNNEVKINLMPAFGASTMDALISMYMGWGKKFIILLDGDKEGNEQKHRYLKKFGKFVSSVIFTLKDIDQKWENKSLEDLFQSSEALSFQQIAASDSIEFKKSQFNLAIQECLILKRRFNWQPETVSRIEKIINFLHTKIQNNP